MPAPVANPESDTRYLDVSCSTGLEAGSELQLSASSSTVGASSSQQFLGSARYARELLLTSRPVASRTPT